MRPHVDEMSGLRGGDCLGRPGVWEQREATQRPQSKGHPFPSFGPCRPRGSAEPEAGHRAPAEH